MDFSDADFKGLLDNEGGFFDVGETIGSIYEILEFIKEGADAEVYRVRNKVDGQEYAAKVPKDGNSGRQFEHETELFKALKGKQRSGHLVKIYPAIEHEGCPVFIMEFLTGRSVQQVIDSDSPKSERRIKKVIKELLKGLDELHSAGIVHCDVTPNNVILTNRGAVLIDLSASVFAENITERTPRRGTRGYMPLDEKPSYAWDIYSVGVIYYQLLLGNRPAWTRDPREKEFTGQALTMPDNFGRYLSHRPILEKALSLDPRKRHFDASEMLAEVRNPLHTDRIGSGIKIFRKRHPVSFIVGILALLALVFWVSSEEPEVEEKSDELYGKHRLNLDYLDSLLADLPQTPGVGAYRSHISDLQAAKQSRNGLVFVIKSVEIRTRKGPFTAYELTLDLDVLAHGKEKEIELSLPWNNYTESFYWKGTKVAHGITKFSQAQISLEGIKPMFNKHVKHKRIDLSEIQPAPDGWLKFSDDGTTYSIRFDGIYVEPSLLEQKIL